MQDKTRQNHFPPAYEGRQQFTPTALSNCRKEQVSASPLTPGRRITGQVVKNDFSAHTLHLALQCPTSAPELTSCCSTCLNPHPGHLLPNIASRLVLLCASKDPMGKMDACPWIRGHTLLQGGSIQQDHQSSTPIANCREQPRFMRLIADDKWRERAGRGLHG